MATVYFARDLKHGRAVAIKVLHASVAATVGSERFLQEIRIAAGLAHPHILPLIDSGEVHGVLYYVMPHVPDGSLRERLRHGGRMEVPDALRIASEIGAALDFAHRQGIVHRDVKPENVLFTDGHAVLADFGIARAPSTTFSSVVTTAGMVLGTPEYMSPEQAAGEATLTGSSDTYALACVLYELLSGEPPLRGAGAQETMAKQVVERPRSVRLLRPDVPLRVDHALMRALAKDRAERFGSVTEFIDALTTESGDVDSANTYRRCIAVLPLVNASPEPDTEYLSDGITDELIDALAKVDGLRVASRTSVFALKGKAQDVRLTGAMLGAEWVLEGTVRRAGQRLRVTVQLASTNDGRLLWSQRFDRTFDDVFSIQEEIAQTIVDTLRSTTLVDLAPPKQGRRTSNVVAYGLYLKGRYAWNRRTQEGVTDAIRFFQAAIAEDPMYAQAYTGLADSFALQIDYRDISAAEGFALAEQYARQALDIDDTVAEAHASLAWSHFIYDWDWTAARRRYARAIELDPSYASAHQWYAFLHAAFGRHDDAIAEAHRALDLDPASVSIRRSIGWLHYYARRYGEARVHLDVALAMHPTSDETHRVLALTYAMQDRWSEAESEVREAVELSAGGTYNRATLAFILARTGRRAEALHELAELEEQATASYVSPVAFATVQLGLGDWERALEWTERAHAERRGWLCYLRVDPMLDPLRGRARFESLVHQMRL